MALVETFLTILVFGLAGVAAAVWSRQRRRPPSAFDAEVPRGAVALGYIVGGVVGGLFGMLVGIALAIVVPADAPEELPAYAIGPGIILGAFLGGYVGRTRALNAAAHRDQALEDR